MQEEAPERLGQVAASVDAMHGLFGSALVAIYLHGSAVSAGLRPQSDIDLLTVIDRPTTAAEREGLLSVLLRISACHPAAPGGPRCIEVMVFVEADLATPDCPARAEFVYGEWLRDGFEASELPVPVSTAENTLVLAQARREARSLFGPPAAQLLPEIPTGDVRRAMRAALPDLLGGLHGDERNVLLTLARAWRTAATGEFVAKDAAAVWAARRMPDQQAGTLDYARRAYLGEVEDQWEGREEDARQAAGYLRQRVSRLL